jgi:hypothetical protein
MAYFGKCGSRCNPLHRRLPEREALLVHVVAQGDERMPPLPGPRLGPPQPRLGLDPLRPMPRPRQETPTSFHRMIWAGIRRRVQPLHRLVAAVGALPQTREPWRAPAPTRWTMVPLPLDQLRLCLRWLRQRLPRGCERLDAAVTRLIRAATGDGPRTARFLHQPPRPLWLLAPPSVSAGSGGAAREPSTGQRAACHGRFPSHTPAFDALGCPGVVRFFFSGRRGRRSLAASCGA